MSDAGGRGAAGLERRSAQRSAAAGLERRAAQQSAVARLGLRALELEDPVALSAELLAEAGRVLGVEVAISTEVGPGELSAPIFEPGGGGTVLVARYGAAGAAGAAAGGVRARPADGDFDTLQAFANLLAGARQRQSAADEMLWRALHDPLTGLPNRVLFDDRLRQALAGCRRHGRQVAVLFLDLDHFKFVNDSLGHSAGDELLSQIAERLRVAMREQDTVARFGGDEFVLICEGLGSPAEAREIAQRAIEVLSAPVTLAGQPHVVTGSLGITIAATGDRSPEDLIREADAAMYEAKEKGRNGYAVFDEVMRARASKRLSTEHQLRRALERGELRLSYQPVVSMPERAVDSLEALVRWQHPERGLIMPEEFIGVAEQTGLIVPIGRWVLAEAMREAQRWQRLWPGRRLPVSVNLSARELTGTELAPTIAALLASHRLDPALLELEITESVLLDPAEAHLESLAALRRQGVRIVLDDFGTGYSSLAYVKRFPIDGLKIDRSFVREMAAATADASIVEAVIAMAKGLRLGVIAEGVETLEQAELLEDMGCVRCQGFAFSAAVEAGALGPLLDGDRLAA